MDYRCEFLDRKPQKLFDIGHPFNLMKQSCLETSRSQTMSTQLFWQQDKKIKKTEDAILRRILFTTGSPREVHAHEHDVADDGHLLLKSDLYRKERYKPVAGVLEAERSRLNMSGLADNRGKNLLL